MVKKMDYKVNEQIHMQELGYKDANCSITNYMQENDLYIKGKIVGYLSESEYKILLEDGRIGKIRCELMDLCEDIEDYINAVTKRKLLNQEQEINRDILGKYINKEYYFEIKNRQDLELKIENVKKMFLDYIIESRSLVRGIIREISDENIYIEVPYGWIVTTTIKNVFGCCRDYSFDYSNYIGAEVSLIIVYDQNANKIYCKLASREYAFVDKTVLYIFPILIGGQGISSKLWLDNLLMIKKTPNYPNIHKNQLVIINSLCADSKNEYKGKVHKVISKKVASWYQKNVLAVGWIKNLSGYSLNNAVQYLKEEGFFYEITYEYSTEIEEETIISMIPDIKDVRIIPRNVLICLTVSQGKVKKYIMPDLIGEHVSIAQERLREQGIKYICKNDQTEGTSVGNHCVKATIPPSGGIVGSNTVATLIIHQKECFESPYALRRGEVLSLSSYSRVKATDYNIQKIMEKEEQDFVVRFILKHKVATSIHLIQAIKLFKNKLISDKKIKDILKKLQSIALIGKMDIEGYTQAYMHFYYPREDLYANYKGKVEYNGFFSRYGKSVRDYKIRCAENQAFLKLYEVLIQKYDIEYQVDWRQKVHKAGEEDIYIKLHIAVRATHKQNREIKVYFIEAARFLMDDEEQLKDIWDKMQRYRILFSDRYEVVPNLVLVFEDEEHFHKFMETKPDDFELIHMQFYYTCDKLTNVKNLGLEKVFIGEKI